MLCLCVLTCVCPCVFVRVCVEQMHSVRSAVSRSLARPSTFARLFHSSSFAAMSAAQQQLAFSKYPFLAKLGLAESNPGVFSGKFENGQGPTFTSVNPATNEPLATISTGTTEQLAACVAAMDRAKPAFAALPLPVRGELVRQIGEALRAKKTELGALVSLEMGKITAEGLGEVQEGQNHMHLRRKRATLASAYQRLLTVLFLCLTCAACVVCVCLWCSH